MGTSTPLTLPLDDGIVVLNGKARRWEADLRFGRPWHVSIRVGETQQYSVTSTALFALNGRRRHCSFCKARHVIVGKRGDFQWFDGGTALAHLDAMSACPEAVR